MPKRHTKNKRQKKTRTRRRRTMKGGNFTPDETQHLEQQGFTNYQIETLQQLGVTMADIQQKMSSIMNQSAEGYFGNSDDMAEQVVTELLNEHIFNNPNANAMNMEPIPHANNDDHHMDMDDDELNLSQHSDNSLHLSDLQADSFDSNDGYTSGESMEWGGKKKRSKKSRKHIKKNKGKKSRKQRGGTCYGTGVGANPNDPNYSIYNTNMLQLFPYKPQ